MKEVTNLSFNWLQLQIGWTSGLQQISRIWIDYLANISFYTAFSLVHVLVVYSESILTVSTGGMRYLVD